MGRNNSQFVLSIGIPLFGKRSPFPQSSCVVTGLVCGIALLKISTPTLPSAPKERSKHHHKNGQQSFHAEMIAELM